MSYTRDNDRYTRGVGAIAALDKGNRARFRNRVARTRRTNRLDAQLAEYTYRPGGGVGAIGAINLTGTRPTATSGRGGAGDLSYHGHAGGTSAPRPPTTVGGAGPQTTTRIPTRLYGGAGTALQQPMATATRTPTAPSRLPPSLPTFGRQPLPAGGTRPTPGVIGQPQLQPVAPLPLPELAPSSSSGGGGGGYTGGGGGGGGGSGVVVDPSMPEMETPVVPDMDPDGGSSFDLKTAAIVGAGALAVWYVFFRKKGGQP